LFNVCIVEPVEAGSEQCEILMRCYSLHLEVAGRLLQGGIVAAVDPATETMAITINIAGERMVFEMVGMLQPGCVLVIMTILHTLPDAVHILGVR
jgi:hypothetical protein